MFYLYIKYISFLLVEMACQYKLYAPFNISAETPEPTR